MNILYHHRTLGDGAEGIHIREMIRAFEALGHSVTTRVAGSTGGTAGPLARLVRQALPQGLFECAAAGHNFVERRQARRLLKDLRPALVYTRHALNSVGMLEAARDTGTPSVLEVNALYSSSALQNFEPLRFPRLAGALEARALDLADLVIVVSSPLQALVYQLAARARTLTLPNGVDPVQFSPAIDGSAVRREHGLEGHDLVIGWSGIIRRWHGLDLVLKALASLPSMVVLIIGDGPERARIETEAASSGVRHQVHFAGRVHREDMPGYLAAIDVGIVADDRTGYASPMKLVEYMAMGKPVVAPDLANIRDIVTDGRHGLLFAQGNTADLSRCLERLRDEELRARLGRCGRDCVLAERNWVANAKSVVQALDAAVARQPAKAS